MTQRSSSDSIIRSLNERAKLMIRFSTTQHIKAVTSSACAKWPPNPSQLSQAQP